MPAILDARGLCKRFGAVTAAEEVSAAIEKDSVVGLIGTNGAGKTTFINMITGYLKPERGAIEYEGRDIKALAPREITRLGICRSFQIPQLYGAHRGQHDGRHRHRARQCRARRLLLARRRIRAGLWKTGGGGRRAHPGALRP